MKNRRIKLTLFFILVQALLLTGCEAEDAVSRWNQSLETLWEDTYSKTIIELEDFSEMEPEQATDTAEEDYSFTEEKFSRYAYDSLSETEQIWYRNINRILGRMQEKQELSVTGLKAGLDETYIDKIFQCVLNDHPEYFYVDGYTFTVYTLGSQLSKIEFTGTYNMDLEEAKRRQAVILTETEILLAGIDSNAGDYEKVKYVYETIIRNTEYNLDAPDNQNIYSVFVNHSSVCQGYAKASQYLLNRLGVECSLVIGTVETGEGHAWNLVKVNNEYYYMDVTWGDASYQLEESEAQVEERSLPDINYDYLCVTTQQLLQTHTIGGVVSMPVCQATAANYYVQERAYFGTLDLGLMAEVFAGAKETGRKEVTLKCADYNVYQEIVRYLIDEQGIFDYLDNPDGTIGYAQNEKQLSMTFWLAAQE